MSEPIDSINNEFPTVDKTPIDDKIPNINRSTSVNASIENDIQGMSRSARANTTTPGKIVSRNQVSGDNYTIHYTDGSSLEHTVNRGVNGFTSDVIEDVVTNIDGTQETTVTISTGTGGVFGRTAPSLPQRSIVTYPDGSKKITDYRYDGTDTEDLINGGSGNPRHQFAEIRQYDKDGNLIGSESLESYRFDTRRGQQSPDSLATYMPKTKKVYDADGKLIEEHDTKGSIYYLENTTYTYDETGALFSTKTYDKEGTLISSTTAPSMTFGGKTYTFSAIELRAIIGSLDAEKQVIANTLSGIGGTCSSLAGTVSSADSGLSGTLNSLSQLCEKCNGTFDKLLSNLSTDISTYISNTVANEENVVTDLNSVDSSINDIMSIFDSINN